MSVSGVWISHSSCVQGLLWLSKDWFELAYFEDPRLVLGVAHDSHESTEMQYIKPGVPARHVGTVCHGPTITHSSTRDVDLGPSTFKRLLYLVY